MNELPANKELRIFARISVVISWPLDAKKMRIPEVKSGPQSGEGDGTRYAAGVCLVNEVFVSIRRGEWVRGKNGIVAGRRKGSRMNANPP